MGHTGKMKNIAEIAEIAEILEERYTSISRLQRNYKWPRECASELAEDLWDAFRNKDKKTSYLLNMITIYRDEKNNRLQILDGQQRLITLKLLLCILEPGRKYLQFSFERDDMLDKEPGRSDFINHLQGNLVEWDDQNRINRSVDVTRLWENYNAMLIPLSFRTVYAFYGRCLEKSLTKHPTEADENKESTEERLSTQEHFKKDLNKEVSEIAEKYFGLGLTQEEKDALTFTQEETASVLKKCEEYSKLFSKEEKKLLEEKEEDDEISDDEIRESEYSNDFQEMWYLKVKNFFGARKNLKIAERYKDKDAEGLADYIKNNVEVLYHETISEPIEEFLNINENKTRFVISDYIRANMISDNPIDGKDLSESDREEHRKNRKKVLELFAQIAEYLYGEKYDVMWELIQKRYDDFDTHPDINRMKVVFCDKYQGTSTKNYKFDEELRRLQYFSDILEDLAWEIGLGAKKGDAGEKTGTPEFWNTYNAVYMLLECKKDYRFFSLFTERDIEEKKELREVTDRERFCFFEEAYQLAKASGDFWDISYFLESQLYYKGRCDVKKGKTLPKKPDKHFDDEEKEKWYQNEWYYVDRGKEPDKLNCCIEELIDKIKRGGGNG